MKKSTWYLILISFVIVTIAIAAQTDWNNGDSGLVVRTAIQANDTELYGTFASYMLLAGSNTISATNTFTGTNDFTGGTLNIGPLNFATTAAGSGDGQLRYIAAPTGLTNKQFTYYTTALQYLLAYDTLPSVDGSTIVYNAANDDFDWGAPAQVVNTIGTFAAPTTTNPYALTAANSYNTSLYYGATGEIDLPAGVDGMSVLIYNTGAFTITIDPDASEAIVRDGTLQTGGVTMTLSTGAGNFVCLVFDGTEWVTKGFKGTLAEGT